MTVDRQKCQKRFLSSAAREAITAKGRGIPGVQEPVIVLRVRRQSAPIGLCSGQRALMRAGRQRLAPILDRLPTALGGHLFTAARAVGPALLELRDGGADLLALHTAGRGTSFCWHCYSTAIIGTQGASLAAGRAVPPDAACLQGETGTANDSPQRAL